MSSVMTPALEVRARITKFLEANPDGVSVTAIVDGTGLSRSAVSKNLTAFEFAGKARRTRTSARGRNQADTWYPVTDTASVRSVKEPDIINAVPARLDEPSTPNPDHQVGKLSDNPGRPEPGTLPSDDPDSTSPDKRPGALEADPEPGGEVLVEADISTGTPGENGPARTGPTVEKGPVEPSDSAGQPEDPDTPEPATLAPESDPTPGPVNLDSGPVGEGTRPAGTKPRRNPKSGTTRAAPGELRAMVATHLDRYPGAEFTAGEIAKVLGRSPGAIQNALAKLTSTGDAVLTCEAPRRYQAAA